MNAVLRSLTMFDWLMIAGASWAILAAVTAIPIGRAMSRADITRRAVYPPPVPPSKPRETDADWLAPWPSDAAEGFDPFWWLSDDDTVNSVIDEMEQEFQA